LEETLKKFMELIGQPSIPASQEPSLEDALEAFRQIVNQPFHKTKDAIVANNEAIARLEGQLGHLVGEFNMIEEEEFKSQKMSREQYMIDKHANATTFGSKEVVKEIVNEPSLEYHTLEMQAEKGETMVPFPNSSSLATEPFIFNTHSSMPSSYNHPPQESLIQHFPTAHIDDLEERANQLVAARHAHT
jgi:hypothetical protein